MPPFLENTMAKRQQTQTKTRTEVEVTFPSRYRIIFHNDDVTPMEFVVKLLVEVFNKGIDEAKEITLQVHHHGKAVAGIYSYEIAEQKMTESVVIINYHNFPLKVTMEQL